MMQAHIFVSGHVQGVWYRQFVKKTSTKLGLTGWVRNLEDNRVEVVLQGKKETVKQMIKLCHDGPPLAEVKSVDVEWEESEEKFKDFIII
ncbi:MAG TPA: acylphosphatase [Candidatus Saccharimonadales bacterium]|nr:acylphosphatase [Candidatus Saccharimonadales bacterium]